MTDTSEIKRMARQYVGETIAKERKKQGLSTWKLAELCGLSQSHIVRIESGRYAVTIDSIAIIAATLGLRLSLG